MQRRQKRLPSFIIQFLASISLLHSLTEAHAIGATDGCGEIAAKIGAEGGLLRSGLTAAELTDHIAKTIGRVPEFEYIRNEAKKMGIRVWLFGGTTSSFLHYAKWDLAREKNILDIQSERFDYDLANIFRSTRNSISLWTQDRMWHGNPWVE